MQKFVLPAGYGFHLHGFEHLPSARSYRKSIRNIPQEAELGRRQLRPSKALYLYLNEEAHASTWVSGGSVPLKLASSYLSLERRGIATPDELRQHRARGMNPMDFEGIFEFADCKNIQFIDCTVNGIHIEHGTISSYLEDAYILCLSQTCSKELMVKLGKRACVKIMDFDLLLKALNGQMEPNAQFGPISYTRGSDRDHFTKSVADEWQDEFRLAWIALCPEPQRIVNVPAGVAIRVPF